MLRAALPPNETERLAALTQTRILDTEPEEPFDRLTDLAARLCGAPIALITLVDVDRQWFKSHFGLEVAETPREVAFCAHAILQPAMLIVRDALADARFADNPLVTADPKIRFYAGSPLVTHDGHALGTFCIIDTIPRDLDSEQAAALETLAHHATTLLDLRRTKELLKQNAEDWERAGEQGDSGACAEALDRLGSNLAQLIEAREQAEASFRDLERRLFALTPGCPQSSALSMFQIDQLLNKIVIDSEHLVRRLSLGHPARREALRIGSTARQARAILSVDGLPELGPMQS